MRGAEKYFISVRFQGHIIFLKNWNFQIHILYGSEMFLSAFPRKEQLHSQAIWCLGDRLTGLEKACAEDQLTWETDLGWRSACRGF